MPGTDELYGDAPLGGMGDQFGPLTLTAAVKSVTTTVSVISILETEVSL